VGQQQLLLLVFGIVAVMLAILMGMIFFEESMQQRHVDLLVSHTTVVASEAIGWRAKHSPYLGGGDSYLKLDAEGMRALLMAEGRMPGILKITRATKDELDIVAVSDQYPELGVMTRVVGEKIVETTIAYDGSITLPEE
jgi:hypothetical protein